MAKVKHTHCPTCGADTCRDTGPCDRHAPTSSASTNLPRRLPGFRLVGEDGNAFAIMGRFERAALRAKLPPDVIKSVMTDAQSGDYDHLVAVFARWSGR